ncbi:MAG: cytochrome-c oxidase [Desulfobacteraceae bacterium]|nr:MAG: cytochrome-c oxidase [Desulfobacteraceae bacterium]
MDSSVHDSNRTIMMFFLSSAVWFLVGTTEGFIDATHMAAPDLLGSVGWLSFGRMRPIHTNTVIFGFVGTALLGISHYIAPVLLKTPLYSNALARIALWSWNLSVLVGTVTLALGFSQGREYAEWIWPVDIGILITLLLSTINLLGTIYQRNERILYVSIWYSLGGAIFIFLIYFFGNAVWNPLTGAIEGGIADGVLAWFYGHGLVGFFLTPLAVGAAYYIIPIVARSPLYSHTLSILGFWAILMFYNQIGAHHLLQAPTPTWLKVIAVTGSVAMLVPVLTALTNLFLTMRGRIGTVHSDIGGKFVFAGLVWYFFVCIQGPFQSLPIVQRVTHFNNWVIAHSHIAVLGFSGFIALGGIYFILPRIMGRGLHNPKLADLQYWMVLIGLTGFFIVLTALGLVQGNSWLNGETEYRVLPQVHMYFVIRAGLGLFIVSGAAIGLYNILLSIREPRLKGAAK